MQITSTGFVRLRQVLAVLPISRSSWWAGIQSGKYPRPVRLAERTTAWKVEDIHALIERLGSPDKPWEAQTTQNRLKTAADQ